MVPNIENFLASWSSRGFARRAEGSRTKVVAILLKFTILFQEVSVKIYWGCRNLNIVIIFFCSPFFRWLLQAFTNFLKLTVFLLIYSSKRAGGNALLFEVLFLSSAHIERLNILKGKNTSALVLSIVVYFGCLECGSSYLIKKSSLFGFWFSHCWLW